MKNVSKLMLVAAFLGIVTSSTGTAANPAAAEQRTKTPPPLTQANVIRDRIAGLEQQIRMSNSEGKKVFGAEKKTLEAKLKGIEQQASKNDTNLGQWLSSIKEDIAEEAAAELADMADSANSESGHTSPDVINPMLMDDADDAVNEYFE